MFFFVNLSSHFKGMQNVSFSICWQLVASDCATNILVVVDPRVSLELVIKSTEVGVILEHQDVNF